MCICNGFCMEGGSGGRTCMPLKVVYVEAVMMFLSLMPHGFVTRLPLAFSLIRYRQSFCFNERDLPEISPYA